jgi:hypothetical protein
MDEKGETLKDKNGEVVYRGEKWKNDQIANLGSEEDFNQEFGNQFFSGNQLMFQTSILRKIKNNKMEFVVRDVPELENLGIPYKEYLKWHPSFDMAKLRDERCKFVMSIDLAGGDEGCYIVYNIFQLIPMSIKEIDALDVFINEKDFFKLVQIGMFRSNTVSITTEAPIIFYHLCVDVILQESLKVVLEMNYEGRYFASQAASLYGDKNKLESDFIFVKFKYVKSRKGGKENEELRTGLYQTEDTREYSRKVIKDKIKYNQMIILESITCEEGLGMAKDKKGKYKSMAGTNDAFLTVLNATHFYETIDMDEQIEEIMEFIPPTFMDKVREKMNKEREADDSGVADMYL